MPEFQHYICKRHLELFLPERTKDRKLHVYSKKEGYIGSKSYNRIAGAVDSYPTDVEKQMSVIEGHAVQALRRLGRGDNIDMANPVERDEWYALLIYMALTASRHPDTIAELRRRIWKEISTHPRLLTNWREMRVENTMFEGLFQATIPYLQQPLQKLQWKIIRIADSSSLFAISDRCVDIAWAGPFGTPNDHTSVVMPICKTAVLVGGKDAAKFGPVFTNVNVDSYNAAFFHRSYEYIFSSEELDYEKLQRDGRIVKHGETLPADKLIIPGQQKIEIWAPFRRE
jgi:hypothetical protein